MTYSLAIQELSETISNRSFSGSQEYVLYVWNLHEMTVKNVIPVKHAATRKPNAWGQYEGKLFYAQQGSKTLYSTQLALFKLLFRR